MASPGGSIEYPVHIGYWTNWSHGRVAGATITLGRNGALLTAFLAVFVTVVGTRLWRIACFALHQYLSSDEAQDGLYHQRQAILRNSANEMDSAGNLVRILVAWRRKASRPFYRILPLFGIALLSVAAFTAAGILSSKVGTAMGKEVLISSPSCGIPFLKTHDPEKLSTILQPWDAQRMMSFANYAEKCYSNNSVEGCGPFIKRQLLTTVERKASCPFKGLCRSEDHNIKLDTGPLNTHKDLGLNAPQNLRFTMRIVNQCAPLITEGFKRNFNYSNDISYMRYYYGNQGDTGAKNHTYEYRQRSDSLMFFENFTTAYPDYSIGVLTANAFNGSLYEDWADFFPIDELFDGDGDVTLIFLSANDILYAQEVNDPWYAAHHVPTRGAKDSDGEAMATYLADEPAAVMGCKMQYQTCDLGTQSCSRFGGMADMNYFSKLTGGDRGKTISWVWGASRDMSNVMMDLRASALVSRYTLQEGSQGPIPDNQWQLDVENWHNIVLASYQDNAVEYAKGPGNAGMLNDFWKQPETNDEKYFCRNQKILSTAYTNFSVLGLVIILVVGGLIILISYTLETIIVFIEKRRGITKHSLLEWFTDETFQLQRLAHEELGVGTWEGCVGTRAVPVTEKGQLLAVLQFQDPQHPTLKPTHKSTVRTDSPTSQDSDEKLANVKTDVKETFSPLTPISPDSTLNGDLSSPVGELHRAANREEEGPEIDTCAARSEYGDHGPGGGLATSMETRRAGSPPPPVSPL